MLGDFVTTFSYFCMIMKILRKADLNDLPAVYEIEKVCFDEESFSFAQFRYLLNKAKSVFLVVEDNKEIAGYIILLEKKRVNGLRIYSIAISPKYQRKGIARRLLDEAEKQTIIKKLDFLYLEVSEKNEKARSLYSQNGFVITGTIPSYYHDSSTALKMRKPMKVKEGKFPISNC